MEIDPAANAGYMVAAYVVTAVILAGYSIVLWRKAKKGSQGAREPGSQ